MRNLVVVLLIAAASVSTIAQAPVTIFVDADGGFSSAMAAAFLKKKVPATVVADKDHAEYVLRAAPVYSKDESGAGKVARCLFLDCAGMNGFSTVSVELIKKDDSSIVWAYQVRKANSGPVAIQSLSEAVAKHLKDDYLKKQK